MLLSPQPPPVTKGISTVTENNSTLVTRNTSAASEEIEEKDEDKRVDNDKYPEDNWNIVGSRRSKKTNLSVKETPGPIVPNEILSSVPPLTLKVSEPKILKQEFVPSAKDLLRS